MHRIEEARRTAALRRDFGGEFMFDSFGDILGGVVAVVAVGYLMFEIDQKRKKLRCLFNVINADDAVMFGQLEDMVAAGVLIPHHRTRAAVAA
jgi:hypothetical protein